MCVCLCVHRHVNSFSLPFNFILFLFCFFSDFLNQFFKNFQYFFMLKMSFVIRIFILSTYNTFFCVCIKSNKSCSIHNQQENDFKKKLLLMKRSWRGHTQFLYLFYTFLQSLLGFNDGKMFFLSIIDGLLHTTDNFPFYFILFSTETLLFNSQSIFSS